MTFLTNRESPVMNFQSINISTRIEFLNVNDREDRSYKKV